MIRLATTPILHATHAAQSVLDMFRHQRTPETLHRPIPAPEPNPEPNPGPDASGRTPGSHITLADWNELFQAIQLRLENCIGDGPSTTRQLTLLDQQDAVKTTVRECISAMQQLQAALDCERAERQAR